MVSELFEIVLRGNKEESCVAARGVRKWLYSSHREGAFGKIDEYVRSAPDVYATIQEDWRQEYFVVAIACLYFLHNFEDQPDRLFPWIFTLLTHKKGNIRYAAVRMLFHELGPLTVHIRHPDFKSRLQRLSPSTADIILASVFVNLNALAECTWEKRFSRYKYIPRLPASAFKSVQMVMSEFEDLCGQTYMDALRKRLGY